VDELITGKPNEINGICCKNGRGDDNFWQLIIVEGTNIASKHAFGKKLGISSYGRGYCYYHYFYYCYYYLHLFDFEPLIQMHFS
jgi:hypothetical protein